MSVGRPPALTNKEVRKCHKEYEKGKTLREISEGRDFHYTTLRRHFVRLGLPVKELRTHGNYVLQSKRQREAKNGECLICGESRLTEVGHIESPKNGGDFTKGNTLLLCPLHHKLFDRGRLDRKEQEILVEKKGKKALEKNDLQYKTGKYA